MPRDISSPFYDTCWIPDQVRNDKVWQIPGHVQNDNRKNHFTLTRGPLFRILPGSRAGTGPDGTIPAPFQQG
ncbi:MAG: hypothetical protein AVO39_00855 [delta proteobacterium MLS_D]|nr:MAG: hypothetical protein AVO39_00855 [delta proteobacterium MLS_D]